MTYLIQCTVDVSPCPPESQAVIGEVTIQTLADIGLTPSSVGSAISFGFGVVLFFALFGFVAGAVIRLIRSI